MRARSIIKLGLFLLILCVAFFGVKHAYLIALGNMPINFYGRAVDQNGDPLSGVAVTYRFQKPRGPWDSYSVVGEVTTDSEGFFQITGKIGTSLGFEKFEKEGYRKTEGQDLSYVYSSSSNQYVPEKGHPIVFTMVSEDKVERLVKGDAALKLKWDGVPVFYDINTGKIGETGEIKITAKRGQVTGEGRKARFDWTFKVEVPGGGVMETTRGASFLAPEKGYKPFWEIGYLASDSNWASGIKGHTYLFFKSEEGRYGCIDFYLSAGLKSKINGRIYSWLNPSGGRVLAK